MKDRQSREVDTQDLGHLGTTVNLSSGGNLSGAKHQLLLLCVGRGWREAHMAYCHLW